MPISSPALPLVHPSLHDSTSAIKLQLTGIPRTTKNQATVETATYGSEFVAAKTATEEIMDLR